MPSATSTNYLHNLYMQFLLEAGTFTPPATYYIALLTTLPALDGTGGVEVSTSGTAYARQPISRDGAAWSGPSGANLEYSNAADLTFPVPTGNWGTIVGGGVFDASSGGNLFYIATLQTPKVVNNGDGAPKILAGQLRISRAVC